MSGILGLLLFIVGIVLILQIVGGLAGLLIALLVAGFIGFAAEGLVPGDRMPHGWLAAIGAGLVGSWLGNVLLGHAGPHLAGFALVPAIVGAVVVVLAVTLVSRRTVR